MQPTEKSLSVIHIILPLSQIKIHNIDGIHLPDFTIGIPQTDVLRHRLRHPVKHPVKIIQFAVVLHLDNQQFPLRILHQDIRPIKLIQSIRLIRLTLQELTDTDVLLQQRG